MENSQEESLLSAVENFSPQPSPNPVDFSDSNRDEREEEEPRGFEEKLYMFEKLSPKAELLSQQTCRLIPATCGPDSIYMTGGKNFIGCKINTRF